MFGALLWGLVAGSAFLLGGALALHVPLRQGAIGLLMGFGGGALIAAVAYELVDEAGQLSTGGGTVALGLIIGSLAYLLATGRWSGGSRTSVDARTKRTAATAASFMSVL